MISQALLPETAGFRDDTPMKGKDQVPNPRTSTLTVFLSAETTGIYLIYTWSLIRWEWNQCISAGTHTNEAVYCFWHNSWQVYKLWCSNGDVEAGGRIVLLTFRTKNYARWESVLWLCCGCGPSHMVFLDILGNTRGWEWHNRNWRSKRLLSTHPGQPSQASEIMDPSHVVRSLCAGHTPSCHAFPANFLD